MDDILLGGIPISVLVLFLVNIAKQLGMETRYAPFANALLSVAFAVVYWAMTAGVLELNLVNGQLIVGYSVTSFLVSSSTHQLGKTKVSFGKKKSA